MYLRILIFLWFSIFIFNYNINANPNPNPNPFRGMILTSITVETNIDGFNNIKVINIKSNIKNNKYSPGFYINNALFEIPGVNVDPMIWIMHKDFDTANFSSQASSFKFYSNSDFDSANYFKFTSFIPKINENDYNNYFLNKRSDINMKLPSDLNYKDTNPFVETDSDSIIFKKISQNEINGVRGEPQVNLKDVIKKFTSIKVSPHTVVSSLNYNLSNDFSINAQWEIENPNTSPARIKKYISDGTANNRPVSLSSFAVNMFF